MDLLPLVCTALSAGSFMAGAVCTRPHAKREMAPPPRPRMATQEEIVATFRALLEGRISTAPGSLELLADCYMTGAVFPLHMGTADPEQEEEPEPPCDYCVPVLTRAQHPTMPWERATTRILLGRGKPTNACSLHARRLIEIGEAHYVEDIRAAMRGGG